MTQFLPIMDGFSANFAPMMGAFLRFAREGIRVVGRTSVAISRASIPPWDFASKDKLDFCRGDVSCQAFTLYLKFLYKITISSFQLRIWLMVL